MLGDLERHRTALHRRGVRFGPSRLGVWTRPAHDHAGCVRCGFCLHGCPIDVIYCSSQTLAKLEKHPLFRYEPGLYVERFRESEEGVEVDAIRAGSREETGDRAATGAPVRFRGRRLFLGCGCYSTARVVTQSLDLYGTEVTMRESQYFLIPMVHRHSFARVAEERLQTLSQICLRLDDPGVCAHDVQMLIYTYSNLYRAALERSAARFLPPIQRALLGRLLALQGYLHSDVSPRLLLSLRKTGAGPPVLGVRGRKNPETTRVVKRIEARLWGLARLLGAAPIPFSTMVAPPGKSYHGGATFSMSRQPAGAGSDLLGRPMKLGRVHVVDASVFPNIPATNLTLTVMANAYRIAAASCEIDGAGAKQGLA